MPYDKNVLAANLRAFRARARMKQSEVAAAVGVTANTIMNYENGEGGIGYETAWALADLFNGLMVIPNLLALLALSGMVSALLKRYDSRRLRRRRSHREEE